MDKTAGIKCTKNASGSKRFLCIDLDMYGENQLIEDFIDLMDVEARKGEPTYPLEEVLEYENKRRGLTNYNKCTSSH
ncbi:MAG: hypothetical protein LBB73_00285 [Dysgonamonadaceae bacterium]|jgi:hypothetical protein|nr:hypothetical protein [Dysgonamonadaceae bacterium]